MSHVPTQLHYTRSHEWAREEKDGSISIGITDHAQGLLGDLVYIELPDVGVVVKAGDEAGVIESVKAASDIYSPIAGEIIAVNESIHDDPALINSDPYEGGWLFRLKPTDKDAVNQLLDADAYQSEISSD